MEATMESSTCPYCGSEINHEEAEGLWLEYKYKKLSEERDRYLYSKSPEDRERYEELSIEISELLDRMAGKNLTESAGVVQG
jgi:DNA repair exonuclease SbcCD ATPase subunit